MARTTGSDYKIENNGKYIRLAYIIIGIRTMRPSMRNKKKIEKFTRPFLFLSRCVCPPDPAYYRLYKRNEIGLRERNENNAFIHFYNQCSSIIRKILVYV